MARRPSTGPTELELQILQAIWRLGPSTVRQVRDALLPERSLAYTSVQTTMTTMVRKKLLRRRMVNGAGVFTVVDAADNTRRSMLRDLLDRVFAGSASQLVHHLLEEADLDEAELRAIRKRLAAHAADDHKPT